MRSEKIGFYFKNPEITSDSFIDVDNFDWGDPSDSAEGLPKETESDAGVPVTAVEGVALALDVEPEEVDKYAKGDLGEVKIKVDDEVAGGKPGMVKKGGSDALVTDPKSSMDDESSEAFVPLPYDDIGTKIEAVATTKKIEILPTIKDPDIDQLDYLMEADFDNIEGFLRSSFESKKIGVARKILKNLGYKNDQIKEIEECRDDGEAVIALAKQWIYTRRSGRENIVDNKVDETIQLTKNIDTLVYGGILPPRDVAKLKDYISKKGSISGSELEKILNYAIEIDDRQRVDIQTVLFGSVKETGGLTKGKVLAQVEAGNVTVGGLERISAAAGINISGIKAFVEAAGVKVSPDMLWIDLVDKKNIIMLQMLVNKANVKQILAMTPEERSEKVDMLKVMVYHAFIDSDENRFKDPTIKDLDAMASKFMMENFGPGHRAGVVLIRGYINNFRDFLEAGGSVYFRNSRPVEEQIYSKADIDKIVLDEIRFWYQNRDQGNRVAFNANQNVLGLPKSTEQIINEAVAARRLTQNEADKLIERRVTITKLMAMANTMYSKEEITDDMIDIATNFFDKEGAFLNLIEMPVMVDGRQGDLADAIACWDELMINSQKDFDYCDIWNESNLARIVDRLGGNEVAARLARDVYFITAGAARFEATLEKGTQSDGVRREETGFYRSLNSEEIAKGVIPNYQKQSKGKVGYRDVLMFPYDFGEGAGLPPHRMILRDGFAMKNVGDIPGVDLRVVAFWDEPRGIKKENLAKKRGYKENPYRVYVEELASKPLDGETVRNRIIAMGQSGNPTLAAWLGNMKGAQATLKAEKDFMLAEQGQMLAKFGDLLNAYGYLRGGKKDVFYRRAACYFEYVCRRNAVPRSGTSTLVSEMVNDFLGKVEGKIKDEDYIKLYNVFNDDRRLKRKHGTEQIPQEVIDAVGVQTTWPQAIRETIVKSLWEAIKSGFN